MNQKKIILPALTAALASLGIVTHAQEIQIAESLLINVDATQSATGALTSITNSGTLGGFFESRGPAGTTPTVAQAGGTLGINLDGNDFLQLVDSLGGAFTAAPAGINGLNPTRSIEVWAYNPSVAGEETMIAWGRRGGDGQNMSFGYGSHGAWGAAAKWGGADIGWVNSGGSLMQHRWHHLVYTYDGTTTRLYADGSLTNSETLGLGVINTAQSGIAIGTQYNSDGNINGDPIRGSLLIAKVRVHDGVLTGEQVQQNYTAERAQMIDPAIPDPQTLTSPPTHRWSFNVPATANGDGVVIPDRIGSADATVRGAGATLTGSRVTIPGGSSATAAYVDLPNFLLSENSVNNFGSGQITLEGWAKVTGARQWSRVMDFGMSAGGEQTGPGTTGLEGLDYLFLTAQVDGSTGIRRVEVRNEEPRGGGNNTMDLMTPTFGQDFHFVITWDEATGEIRYYENGRLEGVLITDEPMSNINDINNWLGRSNYTGDQNMQGEFDEFRIYDRVLAAGEVRGNFLAGPNTLNTGEIPVTIVAQPSNITVQETFTANFTVGVEGSPPISFQWLRNGHPIANATNTSYSFSASTADSGAQFSVIASNSSGGQSQVVTSEVATLTVQSQEVVLRHRYNFWETGTSNEVRDLVGGAHGEVRGHANFSNGQLILDGTDDYVNLPNGLFTNMNSVTLEMWVQNDGSANWARIFDFGNSSAGEDFAPGAGGAAGTSYMFLASPSGFGNLRGALTTTGGGAGEQIIEWSGQNIATSNFTHIAFVINDAADAGRLFVNGVQVGQNLSVTLRPSDLGVTSNNWLGRAQFNDPFWRGRFDEFRIYSGAMTPQQVMASYQQGLPDETPESPVRITRQPASQVVVEGRNVTLSVAADGTWPFSYQWYKNNDLITAGTNNFLTFTATPQTIGTYYVIVSNSEGSARSSNAVISLAPDTFAGRQGRYIGIFAESTARPETSGKILLDIRPNGSYDIIVWIGRYSNSLSYFFDSNGVTRIAAGGRVPVTIDLDLDGSGFEELNGVVVGTNWTAQLALGKVAPAAPAELDGTYTYALLGHADEAVMPGGHSHGKLTLDASGEVTVNGSMADGSKFSTESLLTLSGAIPIYLPLYGKAGGAMVGWILTDTNSGTAELGGNLDWIKLPDPGAVYPQGFRFRTPVEGALYVAPATGRALDVTNGVWLAEGGRITGVIQAEFEWRSNNSIRFTSNTNNVLLKITPSKGTFTGSFIHPQLGTTNTFNGVLIQGTSQFGLGHFIADGQAGAVYIGE